MRTPRHYLAVDAGQRPDMYPQPTFMKLLCLERKRAERSGRRFVLMLLECSALRNQSTGTCLTDKISDALSRSTRETDVIGWRRDGEVIGVIFTEVPDDASSVVPVLSVRVRDALRTALDTGELKDIDLSFHIFPDPDQNSDRGPDALSTFYPDVAHEIESQQVPLLIKRFLDVCGSAAALVLLAPLMLALAIAVKLTSHGPVFFRQQRIGQYGKGFVFLKFRSMYTRADHSIHEAYIKRFISNKTEHTQAGAPVYKLKADPRITPMGRFLRRSSLDELPQLFNVLLGQMSLVGPRPPVPYEFASYASWHRRRLFAVRPGITGLWQVEGRSRVKFDEMVRMDLDYARKWSLWLDIKILCQTPAAVLTGDGAY